MLHRVIAGGVLVLLGAAAHANGQDVAGPGAQIFAKSCRGCHGEGGRGGVGPPLQGGTLTEDAVSQKLTERKPGSMMPQFSNILDAAQRRQVAAYVASLQAAAAKNAVLPRPNPSHPPTLVGNARTGQELFFGSVQTHSCVVCHAVNGRGGRVGPDLATRVGSLSPKQVFERIVAPHRTADPTYASVRIRTKGGQLINGVVEEEGRDQLTIYDTAYLPPRLVSIPRGEILEKTTVNLTVMPKDYASRLTLQQLLDLVAFLKGARQATPPTVRLSDVID